MMRLSVAVVFGMLMAACPKDQVLQPDDGWASGGKQPGTATSDASAGPGNVGGPTSGSGAAVTDTQGASGSPSSSGGPSGGETDGGAGPGGETFGSAADPDCDLNGYWAARQSTVSDAPLIGAQFASNWYFLVLSQEGTTVTVADHDDCGIFVRSKSSLGVTVEVARATMETLIDKNPQNGRTGSMQKDGSGCEFRMQRFWSVRGADPATYLPDGPFTDASLAQLDSQIAIPDTDQTAGAEDWNGPGQAGLGVAWSVRGTASGVRWSVQRDYTEWQTGGRYTITPAMDWDTLTVGARFANEENVLSTDPSNSSTLRALATPITNDERNKLELKFLGRDGNDPRAAAILGLAQVERCFEIQKMLPHTES